MTNKLLIWIARKIAQREDFIDSDEKLRFALLSSFRLAIFASLKRTTSWSFFPKGLTLTRISTSKMVARAFSSLLHKLNVTYLIFWYIVMGLLFIKDLNSGVKKFGVPLGQKLAYLRNFQVCKF